MALKLAILRVNDDDPNDVVVLIQEDLLSELIFEIRRLSRLGFKRRNTNKVKNAFAHVVEITKQRTISLP